MEDVQDRGRERSARGGSPIAIRRSGSTEHGTGGRLASGARRARDRQAWPRGRADLLRLFGARASRDDPAARADHSGFARAAARRHRAAAVRIGDEDARPVFATVLANPGRPKAFGTSLPFGSIWDANEEQRGRPGILSLLAGGGASAARPRASSPATGRRASRTRSSGSDRSARRCWRRGKSSGATRSRVAATRKLDPGFDPSLRPWLARPCDRLFFAGEHEHPVAGIYERRGRKRPAASGGRDCGGSSLQHQKHSEP